MKVRGQIIVRVEHDKVVVSMESGGDEVYRWKEIPCPAEWETATLTIYNVTIDAQVSLA
jgi:hypothetical protein